MKAFQAFAHRHIEKELAQIPPGIREKIREGILILVETGKKPEAELHPAEAELCAMFHRTLQESYRAFLNLGHLLLRAKQSKTEEEFWQFVEARIPRADAELAMQAAQES